MKLNFFERLHRYVFSDFPASFEELCFLYPLDKLDKERESAYAAGGRVEVYVRTYRISWLWWIIFQRVLLQSSKEAISDLHVHT